MMDIRKLIRPHLLKIKPYSSARQEFSGRAQIFLDANENALGSPVLTNFTRYPESTPAALFQKLADFVGQKPENLVLGNGSDELIDLLIRLFVEPKEESILICSPTYGMYEVQTAIHNAGIIDVPLTDNFTLDLPAIKSKLDGRVKIVFVCSPNNPTGNLIPWTQIQELLAAENFIVVVDQAYIEFSDENSSDIDFEQWPNLILMRTFSKIWGLAGLRCGFLIAHPTVIQYLKTIKPPYNVGVHTMEQIELALDNKSWISESRQLLTAERQRLYEYLSTQSFVKKIWPSEANFLLIQVDRAEHLYQYLLNHGIVVRKRSSPQFGTELIRITIGKTQENNVLIQYLNQYNPTS